MSIMEGSTSTREGECSLIPVDEKRFRDLYRKSKDISEYISTEEMEYINTNKGK